MIKGTLVLFLISFWGCGDPEDQTITLSVDTQHPCWASNLKLNSLKIRTLEVNSGQTTVLPHDECLTVNLPNTPGPISEVFRKRGYVVSKVSSTKTTMVVIVGYLKPSCQTPVVCLMSLPIPPENRPANVHFATSCPVKAPKQWDLCKARLALTVP